MGNRNNMVAQRLLGLRAGWHGPAYRSTDAVETLVAAESYKRRLTLPTVLEGKLSGPSAMRHLSCEQEL